ncbi:N-acetylmuramoyl-L-alanine amidase, partial [Francisella tularensis]|uniref:N-acetylmuramoyl-L-alanine amidase n=1 Tax=Francisella tularensis TaxID=263 RepID=UPI0023819948
GEIVQFVSVDERAWHAGVSEFPGRQGWNYFTVGIELQGTDKTAYTEQQSLRLISVLKDLRPVYPTVGNITGHEDIAP